MSSGTLKLYCYVLLLSIHATVPESALAQRTGFEVCGLPIANGKIDDVEVVGIVDTGTSTLLLDPRVVGLLEKAGARPVGSIQVKLPNGTGKNAKLLSVNLSFAGSNHAVSVKGAELSVSGLNSALGMNLDAIFGLDCVGTERFMLRGATGALERWKESSVVDDNVLSLRLEKSRIVCTASVSVLGDREFLLDTGARDSISFTEDELQFLVRAGEAVPVPNGTVPMAQADDTLGRTKQYILRRMDLHGRTLRDVPVTTSDNRLIGMHLLRYTDVFFDLQRAKLHLSWNGAAEEMCLKPGASGLRLRFDQDGGIVVEDSAEESPAKNAGIRPGDRVLSIDGKPSGAWSNYMVKDRLSQGGSTVRLECSRDGQPFTVEFELKHRFAYPPEWPPEREEFNPD